MPPDQSPQVELPPQQAYDFIMNPEKSQRKPFFAGNTSMAVRIAVVAGGLLVLLVIFAILKNIIAGPPKLDAMIPVAQDQQELIHLTSASSLSGRQQNLSGTSQNLASTLQLTINSAQDQLLSYLTQNGIKVKSKVLIQKVSSSLDTELSNAASAGTYDQTFQEVLKSQLGTYTGDLAHAYKQITGPKGRALLNSDYNQAQLLLSEINSPVAANTD